MKINNLDYTFRNVAFSTRNKIICFIEEGLDLYPKIIKYNFTENHFENDRTDKVNPYSLLLVLFVASMMMARE